jgi:hypothetical protein
MLTLSTGLLVKCTHQLHMRDAYVLNGHSNGDTVAVHNNDVVHNAIVFNFNYIGVVNDHDNERIVVNYNDVVDNYIVHDDERIIIRVIDKLIVVCCNASEHSAGVRQQRSSGWRHCWRHCCIASRWRIDCIPCGTQSTKCQSRRRQQHCHGKHKYNNGVEQTNRGHL